MHTQNLPFADLLNANCACTTLSQDLLAQQLEIDDELKGLAQQLQTSHPHLFSQTAVFIDQAQKLAIQNLIQAIETVFASPSYVQLAFKNSPAVSQINNGPKGVFMGYDFHLSDQGPRLIEINTNAGGAFLNAALAKAHHACCQAMTVQGIAFPAQLTSNVFQDFLEMFQAEWRYQYQHLNGQTNCPPLQTIVIVDDQPEQQFLAPEFELARLLFEKQGLEAVIADPQDLTFKNGKLFCKGLKSGLPVDLVYNRLTDFTFEMPQHEALKQAYEAGAAVITPNPYTHAIYAQKSNLMLLNDSALLSQWNIHPSVQAILAKGVPASCLVTVENASRLWAERKNYFFKPVAGYGSKAVYKGEKITKKVWAEIQTHDYIAQQLVPPSERLVNVNGQLEKLKVDIRAYVYEGKIQLLAARTYSGQTTNMRTPGGGFSPVIELPGSLSKACQEQLQLLDFVSG